MDELESALTPPDFDTGSFFRRLNNTVNLESSEIIEDTLNELSDIDEEINFDAFDDPDEIRQRVSRRESRLSQVSSQARIRNGKKRNKGQAPSKVWKKGWQRRWKTSKR